MFVVQMVHQCADSAGHGADVIRLRIVKLGGVAMAAIVEGDDTAAILLQLGNPGWINPVHVLGRCKAVHEQDRIALAFIEIGDFNSAVVKTRHRSSTIWGKGSKAD